MIHRGARRAGVLALLLGASACAGASGRGAPAGVNTTTSAALEANKAVVRRFYAAINAGDYDAADSLVAADYRHHVVTDTGFRAIGWAAFKAGNAGARSAFPDWEVKPDLLVAEGEYVSVLLTGHGTHRGTFADVPATGRSMRLPLAVIHQVRDGRLVADWEVANTEPFMRALRAGGTSAAPSGGIRGEPFRSERITVTTLGSGADVILVPGLTGSAADVWSGTVAAVPGYRYHLVQVHGFAGVPAGANAGNGPVVGPITEEVARYIAAAGLRRPAIIGHSMGGSIAMALAVRHPEAVSRLMVVDMVPFMGAFFGPPGTVTPELAQPIAERIRASWEAASDSAWRAQWTKSMSAMVRDEGARRRSIERAVASDRSVVARAMRDLIVQDLRAEMARVAVPVTVLYVQGPHVPLDQAQTDAVYRAAFASAPHATLRRIPNAYHTIMADQPARFAEEVREFLR